MIISQPLRFPGSAVALLLVLGLAASLAAAPLLPVRLSDQGRVPAGADGHLVVIDGIPLVLTQHQGWMQKEGAGWPALAWEHEGTFAGTFGDGRTAVSYTHLTLPTNREV